MEGRNLSMCKGPETGETHPPTHSKQVNKAGAHTSYRKGGIRQNQEKSWIQRIENYRYVKDLEF